MATIDFGKENLKPFDSNNVFQNDHASPASKKGIRKGRSKSIGPGALDEIENAKTDLKDRRKSAFLPATRSILSKNEDAQKAARRRTMVNRRVSFAPEATLHTWDVIELGRDHTTSTDSTDTTRRNSQFSRSGTPSSDGEDQGEEETEHDNTQSRLNAGKHSADFASPDDVYSSSIASDESDSEANDEDNDDGEESDESEDDTGTAMSLDTGDNTVQSAAGSEESTGSSMRLEAALRQAAQAAGTRGIEYDEYGDMSMEIAGDEITNAFRPWVQKNTGSEPVSSSLDQENVNPFLQEFEASNQNNGSGDSDSDDNSMEMTRAVGGIVNDRRAEPMSSPFSDATMEMTQAVGRITSGKKRRSLAETENMSVDDASSRPKRRRSSAARSSGGDDSMDLTLAVGGIQSTNSPIQTRRTRSSVAKRRSSGVASETDEPTITMEFTMAVGGIKTSTSPEKDDSFDVNEELSMELTTALGSIRGRVSRDHSASPSKSPVQTPPSINQRHDSIDAPASVSASIAKDSPTPASGSRSTTKGRRASRRKSMTPSSPTKTSAIPKLSSQEEAELSSRVVVLKLPDHSLGSSSSSKVSYPDLTSENVEENVKTPVQSPERRADHHTPESAVKSQTNSPMKQQHASPSTPKQLSNIPEARPSTPEHPESATTYPTFAYTTSTVSTPQREPLKEVSPVKQTTPKYTTPKQTTPKNVTPKQMTPRLATPRLTTPRQYTPKILRTPTAQSEAIALAEQRLNEELDVLQSSGRQIKKVGLQEFLTTAGIQFMDLTSTKRRVTTAASPSKSNADQGSDQDDVPLEDNVVACACTVPELDLYKHACHELKRSTKEGRQNVAYLEAETSVENPPFIQAYVNAPSDKRAALDRHMRDMKTNARFQSKKQWYFWRSKLLDELTVGLAKIGDGLAQDHDTLSRAEDLLAQELPSLVEEHKRLEDEALRLKKTANTMTDEEKEEIGAIRKSLFDANNKLEEKGQILQELRQEMREQEDIVAGLRESKAQFSADIRRANSEREACRGISLKEVAALKDSVKHLEDTHGWAITSASSSPSSITMTYKSQLELTFQPSAFQQPNGRSNAPIRLTYIADHNPSSSSSSSSRKGPTTTLRFFLQLLQASLQALPQPSTKIVHLLALVSAGWDTATTVAESERRLSLEAPTQTRILGDDRLDVQSALLLHRVRSKVHVTFEITAAVVVVEDGDTTLPRLEVSVEPNVTVVYGERYHERNMTEFMRGQIRRDGDGDGDGGFTDWDCAVQEIRAKLIARGVKGSRK